jgi:hypothetical protein
MTVLLNVAKPFGEWSRQTHLGKNQLRASVGGKMECEGNSRMRSQPLFVVGSPRSGTTFLVNVLNQHPSIQITNEPEYSPC